jgi:hypothetical protein
MNGIQRAHRAVTRLDIALGRVQPFNKNVLLYVRLVQASSLLINKHLFNEVLQKFVVSTPYLL